jgi:predicted ATPase/DNA-binding SARP family transcriptional activator
VAPPNMNPQSHDAPVRLYSLGRFEVRVGDQVIIDTSWPRAKAKALLKLLALQTSRSLHREQVLDALWPHLTPAAAANNLRKNLHYVRAALAQRGISTPVVDVRGDMVVLAPDVWIDIEAFRHRARTARDSRGDPELYERALSMYGGDLLPEDVYEDWTEPCREEMCRLRDELLLEVARLHVTAGETGLAEDRLHELLRADPLREEAHRSLMRIYVEAGSRDKALRQYRICRELMERDLGVEPSEETEHLHREILEGRLRGPTPAAPPTNLPAPLTSFIGREREMADVQSLLPMTRLLTLTGAGGCGKTRLALEVARGLIEEFPDGVWLVDLAPVADPALVPATVARTLSVRDEPGQALSMTLVEHLRQKRLLLVLDNCEHLVTACAQLAETALRACPGLSTLVTSREPVHVAGELIWVVPPLPAPDPDRPPSLEDLVRYESVQLFVDRARAILPGFAVGIQNGSAIARLCRRLDGIPLAIELAAAQLRTLAVEQIDARLDDGLRLLSSSSRTALPRHQTLQATLDWSHDLISEKEQTLFRRLAVFAGGFALEEAEAVCSGDEIETPEVLGLLTQLVEKSLVVAESAVQGAMRYRMLDTLRRYGWSRLAESGEATTIQRRHADTYLALAEQASEAVYGGVEQTAWWDRLDREYDNMRAALRWSIDGAEHETALPLSAAVYVLWYVRGPASEGLRWLEEALSRGVGASPAARAPALCAAGSLAWWSRGDGERARRLCTESIALYRELKDKQGLAYTLGCLGWIVQSQDDQELATTLATEGLSLYRELGDKWGIGMALVLMAIASQLRGDHEQAAALRDEGLPLLREVGDKEGVAMMLGRSGQLAQRHGDYERATVLCAEGLALFRDIGDKRGAPTCLEALAALASAQGQPDRAARLFGPAQTVREAGGFALPPADRAECERGMAAVRARLGEKAFAAAWAAGREMTLEEAVDYALAAESAGRQQPLESA